MDSDIDRLKIAFKNRQISRRSFLNSLAVLAVAGYGTMGRTHNAAIAAAVSAITQTPASLPSLLCTLPSIVPDELRG